jgi:GNAT superfamily N-acetyltransferase
MRPATAGDAAAIAALLGELGYPSAAADVVVRLERMAAAVGTVALVAERDGRVVGLATGHLIPSIHATPIVAWLTTLVVDARHHGGGVGRQLAEAVEAWARDAGAVRISVTSGLHREGAHAFYEHIGYVRSGVRLTKTLA